MSQYEVKDPDGQVHRIEALNHTNDSLGLTLYASGSAVVAIFPKFAWMRQVQAVVADQPSVPTAPQVGDTASPVASGE